MSDKPPTLSEEQDLFGAKIPAPQFSKLTGKPKRNTQPNGYAAQPGTGPAGETCRSCAHLCRRTMGKTYLKCGKMRPHWTGGTATDVRAKSPACRFWEKEADSVKLGIKTIAK